MKYIFTLAMTLFMPLLLMSTTLADSTTIKTSSSSDKKDFMASVTKPLFGHEGGMLITMKTVDTSLTSTTLIQSETIKQKTLVEAILQAAKKKSTTTIMLNKEQTKVIQPYKRPEAPTLSYLTDTNFPPAYLFWAAHTLEKGGLNALQQNLRTCRYCDDES